MRGRLLQWASKLLKRKPVFVLTCYEVAWRIWWSSLWTRTENLDLSHLTSGTYIRLKIPLQPKGRKRMPKRSPRSAAVEWITSWKCYSLLIYEQFFIAADQMWCYPHFHWQEIHLQDSIAKPLSLFLLSMVNLGCSVLFISPHTVIIFA